MTSTSSRQESQRIPKSILKISKLEPSNLHKVQVSQEKQVSYVPRSVRNKLAADDAEIEALEKVLGIKGKNSLPRAFEEDGLEDLLVGLDGKADGYGVNVRKRRTSDADAWLDNKRRKALQSTNITGKVSDQEDSDFLGIGSEAESALEEVQPNSGEASSESEDFSGFDTMTTVTTSSTIKIRENPYVAPVPSTDVASASKYRPPSLRAVNPSGEDGLRQLRRQLQGLLNRLSEANILGVLTDVEKIYQDKPRHDVSFTLIELLMVLLSDPTVLQDTFIILHAGFIAGVYKLLGTDFGAQVVQRVVEEFNRIFLAKKDHDMNGKKLTNLISLLSELYNFQVIGSGLIYDFIRIFLENLSELNVELLLKVIKSEFSPRIDIENTRFADFLRFWASITTRRSVGSQIYHSSTSTRPCRYGY